MKQRILTALAIIPPVLLAVFCTLPWPILGLAMLIAILGSLELRDLASDGNAGPPLSGIALLGAAGVGLVLEEPAVRFAPLFFAGGLLGLTIALRGSRSRLAGELTSLYLASPLIALVLLHQQGSARSELWQLENPVLIAILPIWAGDTAAIFVGKWIGRHPMAPTISPKKTWEGAIANLFACTAVAALLGPWLGIDAARSVACGAAVGVFGQVGDLVESALKRAVGKKDSGALLPGHGGILDRIDSLLFAAIAVWLILR